MGKRPSNPGKGFGRVHFLVVGIGFSKGGSGKTLFDIVG
jgi:hypothetical protein